MTKAKTGDTVRVHYKGTFDNGEMFDSSEGKEPLKFELGAKQVIPGFERAIIGMEPGQEKDIHMEVEEAYGHYHEERVFTLEKDKVFKPDFKPEPGQFVMVDDRERGRYMSKILEVNGNLIKVDANHPMAGKPLNFHLKLVEIV